MKALIAYFSRNGENYVNGVIKNLSMGNTEIAAKWIQQITGGDMFQINPMVKYSTDYSQCIEEAKKDLQRDARPELEQYPEDVEKYDVLFLCYPNYWGTMPMAVFTFLEKINFSGKTILPLCTHEGSGMANSLQDLKKMCPKAHIRKGLAIRGSDVAMAKHKIEMWIKEENV